MQEPKMHRVNAGSVKFTFSLPEPKVTLTPGVKPAKPPRLRRFKDQNWKAAKFFSKEVAREAIVESIKWLLFGRKRQPAQGRHFARYRT